VKEDTMRMSQVGRTLAAGGLFYVVMAACGSSSHQSTGGPDGSGTSGSNGEVDGAGAIDALIDSITNPVNEASAGPTEVVVEPCNKTAAIGASTFSVAIHDFPGKTMTELSLLHAVGHIVPAFQYTMGAEVFDHGQLHVQLHGSKALVVCGTGGTNQYDSVTFYLPN
jgi:hypothetical protein